MEHSKIKIVMSACLAGKAVRYDGKVKNVLSNLDKIYEKFDVILVCPEVMGGLPIPRPKSEIKHGKVINIEGDDVTEYFIKGAEKTLKLAKENNVEFAILKQNSPSCGSKTVYNGNFENEKVEGMGIAAKVLSDNGIKVIDEKEIHL